MPNHPLHRTRRRCILAGALIAVAAVVLAAGEPGPELRVIAIDIDVRLDIEHGLVEEDVELTFHGQGVRSVRLDVHEALSVERASASSGVVEARKTGSKLGLSFSPALNGSRKVKLRVTGRPGGDGGSRVGASWVVLDPDDAWYPTHPATWATARVRVHAPEGWTVVGVGRPDRKGEGGVWEWSSKEPVRGVAVAGGPTLKLTEAPIVSTELRVASRDDAVTAEALTRRLSDPLAWFSGTLGPYPFDGLNLVFVEGFDGRVDASGLVVVPPGTPLEGTPDGAALLSPQWFGQMIRGDGRWIEAFAAFEAVIYSRDRARPLPHEIDRLRREYFELDGESDVALTRADAETPDAVVLGKGSAAPDMIRLAAGDRPFFQALRDLFATPRIQPVSLAEVRAVLEQRVKRTLERSFTDWFDRAGAPDLDVKLRTTRSSTGGWRADLSVRQLGEPYALPVEVVFHGPGASHKELIEISEESTSVFYVLPFRPTRIEVDPLGRIYRFRKDS